MGQPTYRPPHSLSHMEGYYAVRRRKLGVAAAKLAQYRETLERTDYSDVWERSKKLKLPFFCQLPKDIGNLSSGELAEYTKKVLDADEQGGV